MRIAISHGMGPHGGWLNDERRGARPPANLEHRNPPVVSRGTPYSSPPPSPSHIRDLQHVMAQNKERLSVVAQNNHKIKAMQLQIDILDNRHNEHQAYMERMRGCECHCLDCKRVLSEDATCCHLRSRCETMGQRKKACQGRLFTPMVSTSGQGLGADRVVDGPDRTAWGGPLGTASVG